jgi:cytochrome c-type biogenesis protein CcmH
MARAAAPMLLALALLVVPAVAAAEATQQEVEESLTCQCGCGLTVHSCNHIQCPSGEPMKLEIAQRLGRGESKEQILDAFRQRYGEKVLSSPTFHGFNWLAWIMPFAAVLAGAFGVTVVIRRWVRTAAATPQTPAAPAAGTPAGDPELRRRLERELADFDREV